MSFLILFNLLTSKPNSIEYSLLSGKYDFSILSRWTLRTFTASHHFNALTTSVSIDTWSFSISLGRRLKGQDNFTFAPNRLRVYIFDNATLEWIISPTIKIFLPFRSFKFSYNENESNKACVGCSWS